MPQNPFKQNKDFEQKPNRNAFDLSHSNHFTGNFGTLIPVLCEPVIPGDHFNIQSALALRAMPLPFPVQTKCKAYVHFFYQRNKNLWKNWQDFITENYYTCTKEILASLGEMYVADQRFLKNIDRHGNGTARFMSDAIKAYCK